MPRYRVQIFKQIGNGKEWSNTYHLTSPNLTEASAGATNIATIEAEVHFEQTRFIRARVSDESVGSALYATIPLNYVGFRAGANEPLPLFNTARVDFAVGGGRPSYKFLRNVIDEGGYTQGGMTPALQALIQDSYADALMSLYGNANNPTHITDEDGLPFSGATVWPFVQMRQLNRKKRKKTS